MCAHNYPIITINMRMLKTIKDTQKYDSMITNMHIFKTIKDIRKYGSMIKNMTMITNMHIFKTKKDIQKYGVMINDMTMVSNNIIDNYSAKMIIADGSNIKLFTTQSDIFIKICMFAIKIDPMNIRYILEHHSSSITPDEFMNIVTEAVIKSHAVIRFLTDTICHNDHKLIKCIDNDNILIIFKIMAKIDFAYLTRKVFFRCHYSADDRFKIWKDVIRQDPVQFLDISEKSCGSEEKYEKLRTLALLVGKTRGIDTTVFVKGSVQCQNECTHEYPKPKINVTMDKIDILIEIGESYVCRKNVIFKNIDVSKVHKAVNSLRNLKKFIGNIDIKNNFCHNLLSSLRDNTSNNFMRNIAIFGNPGVGKTEISKLFAKIYMDIGYLQNDTFIIATRGDFVDEYIGHTETKTQSLINKAIGGVLFIDEAYTLFDNSFGKIAIDIINYNLSVNSNFVCIVAGYKTKMINDFFASNPGLDRRFPFKYEMVDYTFDQLKDIFMYKLEQHNIKHDLNELCLRELFKTNNDTNVDNILLRALSKMNNRTLFDDREYMIMRDIFT